MLPSPSASRSTASTVDRAIAFAAGAWRQVGVSGWTSSHEQWAIDPEPLIIFTAWLDDSDIRLRDEATDWCIRNWRYISRTRLRNLARREPDDVQALVGGFAATVAHATGVPWPGATEPRPFTVTGRSVLSPLARPSLVWIRLRSMFGLGARSELLRVLLSSPSESLSVADLARATGYLKRTIADECEVLERAGLLSVRASGNRFLFALSRRRELEALLGELPDLRPDWSAMFHVAREFVLFERTESMADARTVPVHARATLSALQHSLDELDISPPIADLRGAQLSDAVHVLEQSTLANWSKGDATNPVILRH